MKLHIFLLPLFVLFSINSMFAVKTATVPAEKEAVSINEVQPKSTKNQRKTGFFQRILEKKIVKKFTKKLGNAEDDKTKKGGNTFGLLATIVGAIGFLIMLFSQVPVIALLGLILGISAFFLGLVGIKRDESKTLGIVGVILGGLTVFIYLISIAFFIGSIFV